MKYYGDDTEYEITFCHNCLHLSIYCNGKELNNELFLNDEEQFKKTIPNPKYCTIIKKLNEQKLLRLKEILS